MYSPSGSDIFKVDVENVRDIAPGVHVVSGSGNPLVPNIGIVAGDHSILMIDTGAGAGNGARTSALLSRLSEGRRCILSFSHIHPEHYTGFPAFEGWSTIACHADQIEEAMRFRSRSKGVVRSDILALVPDRPLSPEIVYNTSCHSLDLGGRTVLMNNWGTAHSRSDTTFHVLREGIIFMGDLIEEGSFPVFPWFPPDSIAVNGAEWMAVLRACLAERPRIVVPGHGQLGSDQLLQQYLDYMDGLAHEVSGADLSDPRRAGAIQAKMEARYPCWVGREWIGPAVRHFMAAEALSRG